MMTTESQTLRVEVQKNDKPAASAGTTPQIIRSNQLMMTMRVLVVAQESDEHPERQRERADDRKLLDDVERQPDAEVIGHRRDDEGEKYGDDEPHLFQVRAQ
jgi:hypothetical protein